MSEDPYDEWAIRHATVFGLTGESGLDMLREWARLFRLAGYDPADLEGATDALFRSGLPQWPREQLEAIHGHVRGARRDAARAPPADDRGTCVLCGGTGFVVVPHPRVVAAGEWGRRWDTAAVLCECGRGRWLQGQSKVCWDILAQVRTRCPNWQTLMRQREDYFRALYASRAKGPTWNQEFGRIVARAQKAGGN